MKTKLFSKKLATIALSGVMAVYLGGTIVTTASNDFASNYTVTAYAEENGTYISNKKMNGMKLFEKLFNCDVNTEDFIKSWIENPDYKTQFPVVIDDTMTSISGDNDEQIVQNYGILFHFCLNGALNYAFEYSVKHEMGVDVLRSVLDYAYMPNKGTINDIFIYTNENDYEFANALTVDLFKEFNDGLRTAFEYNGIADYDVAEFYTWLHNSFVNESSALKDGKDYTVDLNKTLRSYDDALFACIGVNENTSNKIYEKYLNSKIIDTDDVLLTIGWEIIDNLNAYESDLDDVKQNYCSFTLDDSVWSCYTTNDKIQYLKNCWENGKQVNVAEIVENIFTDEERDYFSTECIVFATNYMLLNFQGCIEEYGLTKENAMCIINETGPVLYELFDLIDAGFQHDFANVIVLAQQTYEDFQAMLEKTYTNEKVTALDELSYYKQFATVQTFSEINSLWTDGVYDQDVLEQINTAVENIKLSKNKEEVDFNKSMGVFYQNYKPSEILSVEKTSSVNSVDTYTITLTNGNTFTFTVTNGAKGEQGEQGVQGIQGKQGGSSLAITALVISVVAILSVTAMCVVTLKKKKN